MGRTGPILGGEFLSMFDVGHLELTSFISAGVRGSGCRRRNALRVPGHDCSTWRTSSFTRHRFTLHPRSPSLHMSLPHARHPAISHAWRPTRSYSSLQQVHLPSCHARERRHPRATSTSYPVNKRTKFSDQGRSCTYSRLHLLRHPHQHHETFLSHM